MGVDIILQHGGDLFNMKDLAVAQDKINTQFELLKQKYGDIYTEIREAAELEAKIKSTVKLTKCKVTYLQAKTAFTKNSNNLLPEQNSSELESLLNQIQEIKNNYKK